MRKEMMRKVKRLTGTQVMGYQELAQYAETLTREQLIELAQAFNILIKQVVELVEEES